MWFERIASIKSAILAKRWVSLGERQELTLDESPVHHIHIIYSLAIQNHCEPHGCFFFFNLWEETEAHREN